MHLLSYIHPVDDFFLVDRKWSLLEFPKDGKTIHIGTKATFVSRILNCIDLSIE